MARRFKQRKRKSTISPQIMASIAKHSAPTLARLIAEQQIKPVAVPQPKSIEELKEDFYNSLFDLVGVAIPIFDNRAGIVAKGAAWAKQQGYSDLGNAGMVLAGAMAIYRNCQK